MEDKIIQILGNKGKMLSGSKTSYKFANPSHEVYFNACVFNEDKVQIWFGDVDFNVDTEKLQILANEIGTIYVTPEHPFRFEGFKVGYEKYGDMVISIKPKI